MKNYINLNGQVIEFTEEQIKKMMESIGTKQKKLADISVGKTFEIGTYEFILLEQSGDTTAVILKNLLYDRKVFGKNNNYDGSDVDKICVEFGDKIAEIIGSDNLISHTVDLTSDDGLKDYGKVNRKMSLLTTELYRRYVETLDNHKIDKWWWLSTAHSTPKHDNATWIKCVSPSGFIYDGSYFINNGVRPFCILNSEIFVSEKGE